MIKAEPPFDTIDLIPVTHTDEDHFDPSLTIKFLLNSSKTQLVCPQQAVKQLAEEASCKTIKSQIHEVKWEEGSFTQMEINGIPIKSLSLNHSEDPAQMRQNMGYIFNLAGSTFIHLGDAEAGIDNVKMFLELKKTDFDIGFIPIWFLKTTEGREIIKTDLRPKTIVWMHVTPENLYDEKILIRDNLKEFPNPIFFQASMENHFVKIKTQPDKK